MKFLQTIKRSYEVVRELAHLPCGRQALCPPTQVYKLVEYAADPYLRVPVHLNPLLHCRPLQSSSRLDLAAFIPDCALNSSEETREQRWRRSKDVLVIRYRPLLV